jgi:hypothetical protein
MDSSFFLGESLDKQEKITIKKRNENAERRENNKKSTKSSGNTV